jgi:hypothetical protein
MDISVVFFKYIYTHVGFFIVCLNAYKPKRFFLLGSMAIGETPFIGQRIASTTSLGDVEIY